MEGSGLDGGIPRVPSVSCVFPANPGTAPERPGQPRAPRAALNVGSATPHRASRSNPPLRYTALQSIKLDVKDKMEMGG